MSKKPKHVAIIMDGNGRWATKQGKKRFAGHNRGAKTVSKIVEQAAKEKIEYLTLFAFSTENWNRPTEEVNILMKLLVSSLRKQFARLIENNIKLSLFQSNIEGELVDEIQNSRTNHNGLIINAGGYTHTSVAIHDALKILKIPIIELHISNIYNREEFRHNSLISKVAKGVICGFGADGYIMSLKAMNKFLDNENR